MANTIGNKFEPVTIKAGRHLREIERRGATTNEKKDNQNNSNDKHSGFSNFRRGAGGILLGAYLVGSALGLGGCATVEGRMQKDLGYQRFYSLWEDYRLVKKNNDVYLQTLNGNLDKQITHTPKIIEIDAQPSIDGKYIIYETQDWVAFISPIFKFYRVPIDKDDTDRKEISKQEAESLTSHLFY